MQFLRALLYNLMLWTSTTIGSLFLISIVTPPQWVARSWSGFNLFCMRTLLGLKMEVRGQEHIPAQPAVYLSNHQSAWETIALPTVLPPFNWVLKRELFWMPLFGWGLWAGGHIGINRASGQKAMQQVIDEGKKRLAKGINVVIFPEGTRTDPQVKKRYKAGGAMLAVEAGVPVIPVAHNAGYFWRRNEFLKRPGTIEVIIGPAIPTAGRGAQEVIAEVEEWIRAHTPAGPTQG